MLKNFLALSLLVIAFAIPAKADQLAYISKENAVRAAKFVKKIKHIYLYCGCCDGDDKTYVKVKKAKAVYTDYEDYYQVMVTYKDANGNKVTEGVDLAYVWIKVDGSVITVGEALNMEHDPCKDLGDVSWPK